MKKKKEVQTERKIYRDFTIDEFDEFTIGLHGEGARYERKAIVRELVRVQINLQNYSNGLGRDSKRTIEGLIDGLKLSLHLIETLPDYEDRPYDECEDY